MLLDRERTGVERDTEDLDVGQEPGPSATNGEDQELRDETRDGDRGVAEEEELVDALYGVVCQGSSVGGQNERKCSRE